MSFLLEQLERRKDDRGLMANLRCYLIDTKRHRAWPALNRLGLAIDTNKEFAVVAAFFATHPLATESGNFGTVCRRLEQSQGGKSGDDSKLSPMERRFQHLLAAEPGQELFDRVSAMVRMAKANSIPINFEQLLIDLGRWNNRTKTAWAAEFWIPGTNKNSAGGTP